MKAGLKEVIDFTFKGVVQEILERTESSQTDFDLFEKFLLDGDPELLPLMSLSDSRMLVGLSRYSLNRGCQTIKKRVTALFDGGTESVYALHLNDGYSPEAAKTLAYVTEPSSMLVTMVKELRGDEVFSAETEAKLVAMSEIGEWSEWIWSEWVGYT